MLFFFFLHGFRMQNKNERLPYGDFLYFLSLQSRYRLNPILPPKHAATKQTESQQLEKAKTKPVHLTIQNSKRGEAPSHSLLLDHERARARELPK